MPEYRIVEPDEAREILLSDGDVNAFLTYMGLFSREILKYLKSRGMRSGTTGYSKLLLHKNAKKLSRAIAGDAYILDFRKNSSRKILKRTYPGDQIYFEASFFWTFSGYARIIYEVLDSPVSPTNPVSILAKAVENNGIKASNYGNKRVCYRYARKLEKLGFEVQLKENINKDLQGYETN